MWLSLIPVSSEKNTPPKDRTRWKISFDSTKSGAGEQFLLLDCRGQAPVQVVFFYTHRYRLELVGFPVASLPRGVLCSGLPGCLPWMPGGESWRMQLDRRSSTGSHEEAR